MCGAQPASKSQPEQMRTTTSALEDLERDRTEASHGMVNQLLPQPGLQGVRDAGHLADLATITTGDPPGLQGIRHMADLATTGDSGVHHPSLRDPDPATQQIEVLTQFGDQQVLTVPKKDKWACSSYLYIIL